MQDWGDGVDGSSSISRAVHALRARDGYATEITADLVD